MTVAMMSEVSVEPDGLRGGNTAAALWIPNPPIEAVRCEHELAEDSVLVTQEFDMAR